MTQAEDLLRLASRCEAEGPSRELDALIWSHVCTPLDFSRYQLDEKATPEFKPDAGGTVTMYAHLPNDPKVYDFGWKPAPFYTSSIDAALQLVPEGAVWTVMTDYELPGRARIHTDTNPLGKWVPPHAVQADGATPALAICAAALRAKAASLHEEKTA